MEGEPRPLYIKAPKMAQLAAMSEAELIEWYDGSTEVELIDPSFFLDELSRRETRSATRWIKWCTVIVAVLTAATVALVWYSIANGP